LAITHTRQVSDHNLYALYDLTPSQGLVLAWLADKILEDRGYWRHTGEQIALATNISEKYANKATKILCELGILSRDRPNGETPYTYRFAWQCPPECSESSHMVKTKSPKPSGGKGKRGGDKSSRHIREPRTEQEKEVKQSDPASSFCNCEMAEQGTIHLENCPRYQKLQESPAWAYTKEQNFAKWPDMDSRQRQLANFESLAKMRLRHQVRDQKTAEQNAGFERDFEDSYKVKSEGWGELSTPWKQYLKEVSSPTADRPFSVIGHKLFIRCAYYTEQGLPVPASPDIKNKNNPYPEIQVPGTEE